MLELELDLEVVGMAELRELQEKANFGQSLLSDC